MSANDSRSGWAKLIPEFIWSKIEGRQLIKSTLGNTGWIFGGNIVKMTVGLLVGVWVARYLGPDKFGQLNFAIAFVALFSSFASLGLENIAVRNIVKNPSQRDEILGTTFVLKVAGGLVAFCAIFLSIFLLRPEDTFTHCLVAIIAAGVAFQPFDVIDYWFKSQIQSKYTVIAKTGAFLCLSLAKIVCILAHSPLIAFAWIALGEVALGALGLIIAYKRVGEKIKVWRAKLAVAKNLLRDSWPLIFSGFVSMIYARIDQVMLGEISGSEELGIYSVAVRLAEMWYFIPMALSVSVFPSIVKAREQSEELFYQRLQKFYKAVALLGYAIAIGMTLLSGWLVGLLFGPAYSTAAPMLALLVWSGLFVNLGVARSSFLMSMNWTKVHLMTVAFGSVVNVTANLILIPKYGGMGAAAATLLSYWVAVHGACYVYRPLFRTGNMLTKALCFPKFW